MDLNTRQNEDKFMALLTAQRYYYELAKKYRTLELILAALCYIAIPIVSVIYPERMFIPIIAALVVLVSDFLLKNLQNKNIEIAARIQELFDTQLFKLPWNGGIAEELLFSDRQISAAKPKHKKKLDNWYPFNTSYDKEEVEILLAQYSNISWDRDLRKIFHSYLGILALLAITLPIISGVVLEFAIENSYIDVSKLSIIGFVTKLLLPALPLIFLFVRSYMKNAVFLSNQKQALEQLKTLLFSSQSVQENQLRNLQDIIFNNRLTGIPIPSKLYNKKRNAYETDMQRAAKELREKNAIA